MVDTLRTRRANAHVRQGFILPAIVIIAFGAGLRLYHLNAQSYWYDESFSWQKSVLPFGAMISELVRDFVHPPLHYLMLSTWLTLFPTDVAAEAGRYFTALFGIACLPALYWLGREMFNPRTALLATALLALSQLGIAYAQEVRPYSQVMLFTIVGLALYVRSIRQRSAWTFAGAAIAFAAAVLTHYYSLLSLGALGLWHLVYARDRLPWYWIVGGVAAVVGAEAVWLANGVIDSALAQTERIAGDLPFYVRAGWNTPFENLAAFANARSVSPIYPAGSNWRIALAGALYAGPIAALASGRSLRRLLAGRRSWLVAAAALALLVAMALLQTKMRVALWFAGGVLLVAPLALHVRPVDKPSEHFAILLGLLVGLPILILVLAAQRGIQFDVRYTLAALAPFYLLAALGVTSLVPSALRWGWSGALLLFAAAGAVVAYANSKEDYRGAMAFARAHMRPGECAAFYPQNYGFPEWVLYGHMATGMPVLSKKLVQEGAPGCAGVWLFIYARADHNARAGEQLAARFAERRPLLEAPEFFWMKLRHFGPERPVQQ